MEDVTEVSGPAQFRALGHELRQRVLFSLGQGEATIGQLATALGVAKGRVAHHMKVLVEAGLVEIARTHQVRGGTELYYRRAARILSYDDPNATAAAFGAIATEVATAEAPVLALRTLHLTPAQVARLTTTLNDLVHGATDAADHHPRYRLLVGLYRPVDPA